MNVLCSMQFELVVHLFPWLGSHPNRILPLYLSNTMQKITVFTTRADTLMGVTYVTLAPEHPLVSSITSDEQKARLKHMLQKHLLVRISIELPQRKRPEFLLVGMPFIP